MKQGSDDIPVACCLSTEEFREREATLLAHFRSAVIGTDELPDGYAFRLPGDGKWIAVVAELIVAERECCPFLRFEVTAHPNMGPVILRVIGPAGGTEFLRNLLCKLEGLPSAFWRRVVG
jgi:hypothetical protein